MFQMCSIYPFCLKDGHDIENKLKAKFGSKKAKMLPAMKRAPPINPYFTTSGNYFFYFFALKTETGRSDEHEWLHGMGGGVKCGMEEAVSGKCFCES